MTGLGQEMNFSRTGLSEWRWRLVEVLADDCHQRTALAPTIPETMATVMVRAVLICQAIRTAGSA
jgi:hypothetical protein